MTDKLKIQPKKGILKNSSSFEAQERERQHDLCKETKWDEMNILATHHPKDKDYGHMKIDEPKTPYNYENPEIDGDGVDGLDADLLAQRIRQGGSEPPRVFNEPEEESEEEIDESQEDKSKRIVFESKRKHHYNEFQAVKLARQLMEQDSEEDDDDEISKPKANCGTITEDNEEMDEGSQTAERCKSDDGKTDKNSSICDTSGI